jgi:hypothetical protein
MNLTVMVKWRAKENPSMIKDSDSLKHRTRNKMSESKTRIKRINSSRKRKNSTRNPEKLRKPNLRSRSKEFFQNSKIRRST